MDETGGTGQERQVGWSIGCGGGGLRNSGRASGGAEGTQELRAPALIEDVFGDRGSVLSSEPWTNAAERYEQSSRSTWLIA